MRAEEDGAREEDEKEKAEEEDPFGDNPFDVNDTAAADGIAFRDEASRANFFIFPAARAAMRAIGER